MIKIIFQKLLDKAGKNYSIDPRIPQKLILINLSKRFWMLVRGLVFYQKRIFIGRNCTVLNKKKYCFW